MSSTSCTINTEKEHFVVKREGYLVPFCRDRIERAIESAFRDTKKRSSTESFSAVDRQIIEETVSNVVTEALSTTKKGEMLTVEGIQDLVEMTLMKQGHYDVARDYIAYRDRHVALREDSPQQIKVKREGKFVRLQPMKITAKLQALFALYAPSTLSLEQKQDAINHIAQTVLSQLVEKAKREGEIEVQEIGNVIETVLMEEKWFELAKHYIVLRSQKKRPAPSFSFPEKSARALKKQFQVQKKDGCVYLLGEEEILKKMKFVCNSVSSETSPEELTQQTLVNFYEGIREEEVMQSHIMAARSKMEFEPAYSFVAAKLLFDKLLQETLGISIDCPDREEKQRTYFKQYIQYGVQIGRLDDRLLSFDFDRLSRALSFERDSRWSYLGLQTLYDRYFISEKEVRLETPQIFWMRVAMGLALNEGQQRSSCAISFYHLISSFAFIPSTPTLFNSGSVHSQLSSCYLSTVDDDLENIFKVIADNAQLSKWAGGIGNDWTSVRAMGARIKGTNGKSQGIIPFLKVANDTALAVNQGGKRKGATCAYLEIWHADIEEFLELRKNTGDDRRRTHDMNTATWIPDLFMKRVLQNEKWTLFSPDEVPDLHDLYGKAFEERYCHYEALAAEGKIALFKEMEATQLWRKMLSMLFETGHPWLTFKDPSNIRSPQDHVGVVHHSNLCTEILLNTSKEETAVCNLGSVNLAEHVTKEGLDVKKWSETIKTAIRMLDNVIDINFYPTKEARRANVQHRPVGLGMMGFQDALYIQKISYASQEAVNFADQSTESLVYHAIQASSDLAKERGSYASYAGSKWDRGLFPLETLQLLQEERGSDYLDVDSSFTLDWSALKQRVAEQGMRNSNTVAIAPTATIANIVGVTQSIEPMYKHLFVKSNLSGEFTSSNGYLVGELKERKLWNKEMLDDLKYFDGIITEIQSIPDDLKKRFLTAFEIDPEWLIACASRRQKWIDMGQSLNIYLSKPSGKTLERIYLDAWKKGLKTTYYLRSLGATQIEKSTLDINKRGLQPKWMKNDSPSSRISVQRGEKKLPQACSLDEGCESCQ